MKIQPLSFVVPPQEAVKTHGAKSKTSSFAKRTNSNLAKWSKNQITTLESECSFIMSMF